MCGNKINLCKEHQCYSEEVVKIRRRKSMINKHMHKEEGKNLLGKVGDKDYWLSSPPAFFKRHL